MNLTTSTSLWLPIIFLLLSKRTERLLATKVMYKLPYPDYKISLVNPKEKEWRLFKARFNLNGRDVVGSGKTIKEAEMAAARKYLSNNFLSGENSPQAEILNPSHANDDVEQLTPTPPPRLGRTTSSSSLQSQLLPSQP